MRGGENMINIVREKILHKGYATKSDIRKFIPCGHDRACMIFNEIKKDIDQSGKINLLDSVLSKRLLAYVGLTEKQVIDYAKQEKVDLAESTKD